MHVTVIFTSLLHTIAGVEHKVLEVAEGTTIEGLSGILAQKYPDLPLETEKTYFILNDEVTAQDQVLEEGDHVRILRMLAGG
jgi:molybdopterin converting factor small subunit